MSFADGSVPERLAAAPVSLLRRTQGDMELRAEIELVRYRGACPRRDAADGDLLVGVYRRSTGEVQLFRGPQFVMQPELKRPRLGLDAPAAAADGGIQKQGLVSELGSEKARKKQRTTMAKQVRAEAVFNGSGLSNDVSNALESATAPQALTPQQERPGHPPFVLSATTVREAYPVEGIMPPALLAKLADTQGLVAAGKAPQPAPPVGQVPKWPQFALQQLEALPAGVQEKLQRLKMLLYASYMVRFHGISGAVDASRATKLDIPMDVWHHLVAEFTEQGAAREAEKSLGADGQPASALGPSTAATSRRVTDPMKQKLVLHVLALALLVTNGKLEHESLAKNLKLTAERCTFFLRQLGCAAIKSPAGEKLAVLQLPLNLPQVTRRRARGRQ